MKAALCPGCGEFLDDCTPTGPGRVQPRPGDVTVCAYCAAVLVFDGEPVSVRLPTNAEVTELRGMPRLAQVRTAAILARMVRGPRPRPRPN